LLLYIFTRFFIFVAGQNRLAAAQTKAPANQAAPAFLWTTAKCRIC
jgi:hypothetical protein